MEYNKAELYSEVVDKLIGKVEPVGDTTIDYARFDNLLLLEQLLDNQIDTMYKVAQYKNDSYYSRERAGKEAMDWFRELYDYCGDILKECDDE